MSNENSNRALLQYICRFAEDLLKSVLQERCNLGTPFYLPGLPLLDEELIKAFEDRDSFPEAPIELRKRWKGLYEHLTTSDVLDDSPRMIQLCYLYGLEEIWLLAVILSYAYQLEPKFQKTFAVLQGDSGRKGPDIYIISALAHYLNIEHSDVSLRMEDRAKRELFEATVDGQLFLKDFVFLWLNEETKNSLFRQGIFQIYQDDVEQSVIRVAELDQFTVIAKRQIEENAEKQLVMELRGSIGAGKKYFAREVVKRLGYRLCVLNMAVLLELSEKEIRNVLQEVYFTTCVKEGVLYLDFGHCKEEAAGVLQWAREILSEYFFVFMGVDLDSTISKQLSLPTQSLSFDKMSSQDSLALWKWMGKQYLVEEKMDYEQLAGKYRLLPGAIKETFIRAERYRFEKQMPSIDFSLLLSSIRECNQVIGNNLMERINTVFQWEDLRVEPHVIFHMKLACSHLKNRFQAQEAMGKKFPYGTGVGVLMYGPPGTGKTMAAQVMANELQMDLYRVDLSQVSSKYIGETEKNLEKIFKEAEQSNVILFFDEADAMFGKRTEVKDSNDKYANQETSYILQRIESYEGMVILATNFAQNFDNAFMRRITVSIRFSLPDENTRKLLWQDMLQATELVNDISIIEALAAQFELSGSNIKNIVRNAEFLALMEQRTLSVVDIVQAIKIEFEKLGKLCNANTFGMFMGYI